MAAVGTAEEDRQLVAHQLAAAVGEDGRSAVETCPLLLAAFGREPSNPATVWSNGATDGGSHDPNRIELPVVARHPRNRSQERHRRARCLKNPVPEAARTGLQDFRRGSSEPMIPIEEKIELRWTQMKAYFPLAKAKKLIPRYAESFSRNG